MQKQRQGAGEGRHAARRHRNKAREASALATQVSTYIFKDSLRVARWKKISLAKQLRIAIDREERFRQQERDARPMGSPVRRVSMVTNRDAAPQETPLVNPDIDYRKDED